MTYCCNTISVMLLLAISVIHGFIPAEVPAFLSCCSTPSCVDDQGAASLVDLRGAWRCVCIEVTCWDLAACCWFQSSNLATVSCWIFHHSGWIPFDWRLKMNCFYERQVKDLISVYMNESRLLYYLLSVRVSSISLLLLWFGLFSR